MDNLKEEMKESVVEEDHNYNNSAGDRVAVPEVNTFYPHAPAALTLENLFGYTRDNELNTDVGTYLNCDIEDELIGKEYPFDLARQWSLPPLCCVTGSIGRNYSVIRLLHGAAGTELKSGMVECWIQPNIILFKCGFEQPGRTNHGIWKVEHGRGTVKEAGFVCHSLKCNCLQDKALSRDSWESIIDCKYETKFMALSAVAFFFGRVLVYFPKSIYVDGDMSLESQTEAVYSRSEREIRSDIEVNNGESRLHLPSFSENSGSIVYHRTKESEIEQVLSVNLYWKNGGYYINDPLDRNARLQSKTCLQCYFANKKSDDKGFRMMFGLECGKHVVCEKCVFYFFTEEQREVCHSKTHVCKLCDVSMRGIVYVSLEGVRVMKTPVALEYFDQKPVFSSPVRDLLGDFFRSSINWAIKGLEEAEMNGKFSRCAVKEYEDIVTHLLDVPEVMVYDRSVRAVMNRIKMWEDIRDKWELVLVWLEYRKHHFSWALANDKPFPQKFLDRDRKFYNVKLNQNEFEMLRLRARVAMDAGLDCSLKGIHKRRFMDKYNVFVY